MVSADFADERRLSEEIRMSDTAEPNGAGLPKRATHVSLWQPPRSYHRNRSSFVVRDETASFGLHPVKCGSLLPTKAGFPLATGCSKPIRLGFAALAPGHYFPHIDASPRVSPCIKVQYINHEKIICKASSRQYRIDPIPISADYRGLPEEIVQKLPVHCANKNFQA